MELNSIDVVTLDYSEYLRMSSNSGIYVEGFFELGKSQMHHTLW